MKIAVGARWTDCQRDDEAIFEYVVSFCILPKYVTPMIHHASAKTVAIVSIFAIYCFAITSHPYVFDKNAGNLLSLIFMGMAAIGCLEAIGIPLKNEKLLKVVRFLSIYYPFLLLLGITSFTLPALNENLYGSRPEAKTAYNGLVALGGVIPVSDSNNYLTAILSFLKSGDLIGVVQYRPFPTIVSAVLFKLSGWDIFRYYQLSSLFIVVSIWYQAMTVSRFLGKAVAVLNAWMLCNYFSGFQGTFLTESIGGLFGMVGISILLHGLYSMSLGRYCVGSTFIVLGLSMRPGVVLFPLALIGIGTIVFRSRFRTFFTPLLACVLAFTLSAAVPTIQNKLLKKPVDVQSNAISLIYQVLVNSDTWLVFEKKYPYKDANGRYLKTEERVGAARNEIIGEIKKKPLIFLGNYVAMMRRYIPKFEHYLIPWPIFGLPRTLVLLSTLLFFSGLLFPEWRRKRGKLAMLVGANLLCSVLLLPFLNENFARVYAATISLNTLMASVAIFNLGLLAKRMLSRSRFSETGSDHSKPSTLLGLQIAQMSESVAATMKIFPALLIMIGLLGPLMVDRFRKIESLPSNYAAQWQKTEGAVIEVIKVGQSPHVLLDTSRVRNMSDRSVLPAWKWKRDWRGDHAPSRSSYWLSCFNLLDVGRTEIYIHQMLLPESMLGGLPLSNIDTLVVKRNKEWSSSEYRFYEVMEVLKTVPEK